MAVAAGGVIGTAIRYLSGLVYPVEPGHWPLTTFVINIAGAFFLGWLMEALTRVGPGFGWLQHARLFFGTGFTGSFTTYSSLAVETDRLVGDGHALVGVSYLLTSVLFGAAAAIGGIALAGASHRRTTGNAAP
jgi:CrcB protein